MTMRDKDGSPDAMLDALFEAGRAARPEPSPALMERLRADALAEQPRPGLQPRAAWPAGGRLARWLDAIGGWPGMAGLVAASAAGLWIGVADPVGITDLAGGDRSAVEYDLTDLVPGFPDLLAEEGEV